ncbi:MAG: ribulose-phosphate 3-epimerase [Candidatus Woesearchaeota archaeon]
MGGRIIPSILAADQERLQEAVKKVESCCKALHIDVMDARFVPDESYSPDIVELLDTSLHKQVHLMTLEPDKKIEAYAAAGADTIIIHAEAFKSDKNAIDTLKKIKQLGITAGISINPDTSVENIKGILKEDCIDLVLVMTVHPGKSGQEMIIKVLDKIKGIKDINDSVDVEVDGGINRSTIGKAEEAGADLFVAGEAVFSGDDPAKAVENLEEGLKEK